MNIEIGGRIIGTAIDEAVYIVLGGPTRTANAVGVSGVTIRNFTLRGMVRNREMALKLEGLTAAAGCRISAPELMQLVPWHGPTRHPEARPVRRMTKARKSRKIARAA